MTSLVHNMFGQGRITPVDYGAVYDFYMVYRDLRPMFPGYKNGWWPRGNALLGDTAVDVGVLDSVQWGAFDQVGGESSMLGIIGVTRDQYGTPVGSCVIQLFLTSNDALMYEGTSDANGNFNALTTSTGQHYVVAYKATAPDIFGTTVNTLVGA